MILADSSQPLRDQHPHNRRKCEHRHQETLAAAGTEFKLIQGANYIHVGIIDAP